MALAIGTVVALLFLEGPWRWVLIAGVAALEVAEAGLWVQLRRRRPISGVEALIGARGRAVTDCRPEGQVRVEGRLWSATCTEGAGAGDEVIVTAIKELRLEIVTAGATSTSSSGPPRRARHTGHSDAPG